MWRRGWARGAREGGLWDENWGLCGWTGASLSKQVVRLLPFGVVKFSTYEKAIPVSDMDIDLFKLGLVQCVIVGK